MPAVILAIASTLASDLPAQLSWVQRAPTVSPSPRRGHAMAYDNQRGRTVLFGGIDGAGRILADTWEWDGTTWTRRSPATSPGARFWHSMSYDSQRHRTVLFGGGTPANETWEWDGTNWVQRFPANVPTGSIWGSLPCAYDSQRGRTVLLGAWETWEWDGFDWLTMPAGGPYGWANALAYDSQRGRTVFFGTSSMISYTDTWEWDGSGWLLLSSVGPAYRSRHAMAFDAQRARTVLFGGTCSSGCPLADTWEWSGGSWAQATLAVSPPARSEHAMAYDSQRGVSVLFGGLLSSGLAEDTWELGVPTTPATAQPYGTSCGSPPVLLSASPGSRPVVGQSQVSEISNASLGFAFVAWGLSNQFWGSLALPVSLDPFGFEGCQLWQSADQDLASPCVSTGLNAAQHVLAIPVLPGIVGMHVYLQAWTLQPTYNTIGIVLSNGLDLTIGDV